MEWLGRVGPRGGGGRRAVQHDNEVAVGRGWWWRRW
jgi:hypothetical protein